MTKAEFKPDPIINTPVDKEFVPETFEDKYVPLPQKVYVKAGEMMSDKGYEETYLVQFLVQNYKSSCVGQI